jgi:hypothetical protein
MKTPEMNIYNELILLLNIETDNNNEFAVARGIVKYYESISMTNKNKDEF